MADFPGPACVGWVKVEKIIPTAKPGGYLLYGKDIEFVMQASPPTGPGIGLSGGGVC